MPIYYICEKCRKKYFLPDTSVGKTAKCKCGQVFTVPKPEIGRWRSSAISAAIWIIGGVLLALALFTLAYWAMK